MSDVRTERDPAVQGLLDREAIREVIVRYCRGCDRLDVDLIDSAFHPDAVVAHGASTFTGRTVGRELVDRLRRSMSIGSHHISNQTIEIAGDSAGCESYYIGCHVVRSGDAARALHTSGRYLDRLERRNGEWKITKRLLVSEMTRYLDSGEELPDPFERLNRPDRSDPSYAFLAPSAARSGAA